MEKKHRVYSYTAIAQFHKCRRRYLEERLEKRYPYQQSEEAKWGDYVHNCLEAAFMRGEPLPDNVSQYQPLIDALQERVEKGWSVLCEQTLAVDKAFSSARFDGRKETWWNPEYLFAGKIDVLMLSPDYTGAVIADWKTNKSSRYAEPEQLEVYALATMLLDPRIQTVETALIFICDNYKLVKATYTRNDINRLRTKWRDKKIAEIEAAIATNNFPESEYTPLCGWCPCSECPNWQAGQDFRAKKKRGR